jgi:DNA polymerase elongation subunit (family B)
MDMLAIYDYITARGEEGRKLDLDTVGKKELGFGKLPLGPEDDYEILYEWYKNDQESLKAYCRRDVEIIVGLDKKYSAIDTRKIATNLVHVNPDTYLTFGMGVEGLIRYELSRFDPRIAVRSVLRKKKYGKETYGGAIVVKPAAGIVDWIVVLDFKSMYNRIMQAWNIGPDTLSADGEIVTPDIYKTDKNGEKVFYAKGARYSTGHKSSFARALEKLEKYRHDSQKRMEQFAPHSDEWAKLDKEQYMYKVNLLAFYGVTGDKDSDMYTEAIAASITAVGRECLETAKQRVEELGYQVVYGDTDSIFVACPQCAGDLEKTLEFGKYLCDDISEYVSAHWMSKSGIKNLKLEVNTDKLFTRLLFTEAKKRYAGWMMWQGGLVNPEYLCQKCGQFAKASDVLNIPEADIGKFLNEVKTIDGVWDAIKNKLALCPRCSGPLGSNPKLHLYIAGFETKRRDWTVYAKNMQRKVFEMLLDEKPRPEIIKWLRSYVQEMYDKKHDDELSFSKPLRKDLEQYKANPPHVKAAKKILERTHVAPLRGSYVTYYVLDEHGGLEPVIKSTQKIILDEPAYEYAFRHQVSGILERLGFQEFELKIISCGTEQTSIDSF